MNTVNVLLMVRNAIIVADWDSLANTVDKRNFPPLVVEDQEEVQQILCWQSLIRH